MNHEALLHRLGAEIKLCLLDPTDSGHPANVKPECRRRHRRLLRVRAQAERLHADRQPIHGLTLYGGTGDVYRETFNPPLKWHELDAAWTGFLARYREHRAARQPVWDAVTSTEREGAVAGWLDQGHLYS